VLATARGATVANLGRWIGSSDAAPDVLRGAVGAVWALVMATLFIVAHRDHHQLFTSRFECGTDPVEILRVGEIIERSTLRFIVDAHCANPRYVSEERIELRYHGGKVDVETRKLDIPGASYYQIVSVGGWTLD
jgi:hypothetical protein